MKHCKQCGKNHREGHVHLMPKLNDRGFPTHAKKYKEAHEKANKAEKKKFGAKSYDALKKIDSRLSKHELAGKNTKTGKVEVSKKIPSKYRSEVAYHEKVENRELRKKK